MTEHQWIIVLAAALPPALVISFAFGWYRGAMAVRKLFRDSIDK